MTALDRTKRRSRVCRSQQDPCLDHGRERELVVHETVTRGNTRYPEFALGLFLRSDGMTAQTLWSDGHVYENMDGYVLPIESDR